MWDHLMGTNYTGSDSGSARADNAIKQVLSIIMIMIMMMTRMRVMMMMSVMTIVKVKTMMTIILNRLPWLVAALLRGASSQKRRRNKFQTRKLEFCETLD